MALLSSAFQFAGLDLQKKITETGMGELVTGGL